MDEEIKVSIVIPTYRRPNMLARLLDSILEQNFPNLEIIVINDEKTNSTNYESIVDSYSKRFNFFTFLNNKVNKGAPYSRNRGINLAKSNFICLIDDDDEMLPNKIKMQYQKIKDSDFDIVYTFTYVSENNERVKGVYESRLTGNLKKQILKNCFIPSPSVMVKKSSIISAGLFDEKMPSCQDWDMWTRMILNGSKCAVVPEYLTIYHKHEYGNIGLSNKAFIGYVMYHKKHMIVIIKNLGLTGLVSILKIFYGWFKRNYFK